MTNGILKSINTKDILYKKMVQASITNLDVYDTLKTNFNTYKNILRQSIREAKKLYYNKTFLLYKNNIEKTWSTIKETLNRTNNTKDIPLIYNNGAIIQDPTELANAFNSYFIDIGSNLADQISSEETFDSYLNEDVHPNFKLNQIDEKRVSMVIKRLKNKFSYGLDGISNFLIKNCSEVLSKPLTLIINQTLTSGIFPEKLKSSKVIPIFKSGEVSCISNYRPISQLPSLSKIFEYVILDQLTDYLIKNNILCYEQFGFRSGYSTELAALRLIDRMISHLDAGRIPLNSYIDLSKAFDTLDHTILLEKLRHYVIRDTELQLIKNYLSNRYQLTEEN